MSGAWSNDQLNALYVYNSSTGSLILRVNENGFVYFTPNRFFLMDSNAFSIVPVPPDGSFIQMTTATGFGGVLFLQPTSSNVGGVTFSPGILYASRDEVLVGPTTTRPFMKMFSPIVTGLHSAQVIVHGQSSSSAVDDSFTEIVGALAYQRLFDQLTADAAAITSTTLVAVNTLTINKTGTYTFDGLWILTNTGAAGRPAFALGGTSTASAWRWASATGHYNTTTNQGFNASGTTYPASGSNLVNTDFTTTAGFSHTHIKGTVTITAPGTLTFCFATSGAVGQNVNLKAASMVTAELAANY